MKSNKYCVIMAGGIGSRFWPMSRTSRPKQFLDILGTGKTFIRRTYERFATMFPAENFLVVTNSIYKQLVLDELPELKPNQILAEPIGRNTAPCIAYAAFRLNAIDPNSQMVVTPSDHLIMDTEEFMGIIEESLKFIEEKDSIMTIGVKPDHPNTGYGYIQVDNGSDKREGICQVKTFTEKPNEELAKAFIDSGEFFWNSGIFIWNTKRILEEFELQLDDLYTLFKSIEEHYNTEDEYEHIKKVYSTSRAISIDFGVMEKAKNVYVNCGSFGWSDIGTWDALYQHSKKDEEGNVAPPYNALYNTKNCIIKVRDDKLVVTDGLEDYIIVDKDNVLMIVPKSNAQNVKSYMEEVRYKEGDKFI